MPKLTPAQQNARRQHILTSAKVCFAQNGFHNTTMQTICREAGISAGALYLYFGSKETLIEGLVEQERERIVSDFAKLHDAPDFLSGIQQMAERCSSEDFEMKAALFFEAVAESMRNPMIQTMVKKMDDTIRGATVAFLERAKADGSIAPSVSIDTLAAIMGVIFDGLFLRRAVDRTFDTRAIGNQMLQMIHAVASGRPIEREPNINNETLEPAQ